jgi:hypothetical protein
MANRSKGIMTTEETGYEKQWHSDSPKRIDARN